MLIALLTLMLLGGGSYDLSTFIAEGQENIAGAVEDPERRQSALDILAAMEASMASDNSETTALIERTQEAFSEDKVWSAEELDAVEVNQLYGCFHYFFIFIDSRPCNN